MKIINILLLISAACFSTNELTAYSPEHSNSRPMALAPKNEALTLPLSNKTQLPIDSLITKTYPLNFNNQPLTAIWKKDIIFEYEYGQIDLNINLDKYSENIGFIKYQKNLKDNSCYISLFQIEPRWRNQQFGANFIKFVCSKFIEQKTKKIWLHASPFELSGEQYRKMLPKLIKFYKSCGFENSFTNPKLMTFKIPTNQANLLILKLLPRLFSRP